MEDASASSIKPHFFQPLLPGFNSHLNIPLAFFSKHMKATTREGNTVVMLRSDASDITWEVKLDGQRLTQGWQKYATSHDLRVGDILVFRLDGYLLFHVTCLGPHCCEIQYEDDDYDDNEDDGVDNVTQIHSDSGSENYCQRTGEAHSCFGARVTAANLRRDTLYLPKDFSKSNGLMNRKCEIVLLNEDGKPWRLLMGYHKTHGYVFIRNGWRSFCHENHKTASGLVGFKLVQAGARPVLQLFTTTSMYNRAASFSISRGRFLTLTLTPYNLKAYKLYLPATFVKANGMENVRKITLVDRYGIRRTTSLKPENNYGRVRLGKEWREFCEVHGVKKTGESFKLELIKEEEEEEDKTTYLLKFCSSVMNN